MPEDDIAALVRRVDPDRFFCALFAPAAVRAHLWLLAAFNHELARARAMVREPAVMHIRLQWWREVLEGAERRHPVATPLTAALRAGLLEPEGLLRMIDGREIEAEDCIETVELWRAYLLATQGELTAQAGRLLGVGALDRLRLVGAAYGAGWLLRTGRRSLLPAGVGAAELAGIGLGWLREGWVRLPRGQRASVLPGVLAGRDLRRFGVPFVGRGIGDRLAVVLACVGG